MAERQGRKWNSADILLVEDDAFTRACLAEFLRHAGHRVLTAQCGAEALERFKGHASDIVLLDLQLPDIHGIEVLAAMHAVDPAAAVLVVTGDGGRESVVRALRSGAWDYIEKARGYDELVLAAVERALVRLSLMRENRRARDQLEEEVRRRTAELSIVNESLRREVAVRAESEERLRASLAEKDALLREIHHRVKNNLQLVISLLNLEVDRAGSEELRECLRGSMERIRSMAGVHEEIYRCQSLSRIGMLPIARSVAGRIAVELRRGRDIGCEVRGDEVTLSIERAVPCGLILGELVANAFLHGFPEGGPGKVEVAFAREGETRVLRVTDDGCGLPEGISLEAPASLGMTLVKALVSQLDADAEVRKNPGTCFTFRFADCKG